MENKDLLFCHIFHKVFCGSYCIPQCIKWNKRKREKKKEERKLRKEDGRKKEEE